MKTYKVKSTRSSAVRVANFISSDVEKTLPSSKRFLLSFPLNSRVDEVLLFVDSLSGLVFNKSSYYVSFSSMKPVNDLFLFVEVFVYDASRFPSR